MAQELNQTARISVVEWILKDSSGVPIRKKLIKSAEITASYELDTQREVETVTFLHGEKELMTISSDSQSPDYNNTFDAQGGSNVPILYDNWRDRYMLA